MSDHYYSTVPQSDRDEHTFETVLRGINMRFTTDAGVFSKRHVDRGTRLLVESIPLPTEGTILDLGCGYGAIGLTLACLRPDLNVVMVDVNARACELARRNAVTNGVLNVSVFHGDGLEGVREEGPFAAIVSNPPYRAGKKVVFSLLKDAHFRLHPGGYLAVVGQTKQGIKSVKSHLQQVFGNVEDVAKQGGYRVLIAYRR